MKKNELAARLAEEAGLSRAAAADQLDQVIHDILTSLRSGKPASFPGLGKFIPGPGFRFQPRDAEAVKETGDTPGSIRGISPLQGPAGAPPGFFHGFAARRRRK